MGCWPALLTSLGCRRSKRFILTQGFRGFCLRPGTLTAGRLCGKTAYDGTTWYMRWSRTVYITSWEQRNAKGWSPQASQERGVPSPQAPPPEGFTSSTKYHVGDQTFSTWGFGDTQDPKGSSKHTWCSHCLHIRVTLVVSPFPKAFLVDEAA